MERAMCHSSTYNVDLQCTVDVARVINMSARSRSRCLLYDLKSLKKSIEWEERCSLHVIQVTVPIRLAW
jgi:hypothetical protein